MLKNIIPIPKKIQQLEGMLTATPILCTDQPDWEVFVDTAVDSLSRIHFSDFSKGEGSILLTKNNNLKPGSYTIDADNKVIISASDREGICYGIATFLQLAEFNPNSGTVSVEKCRIEDWPDKDYRALMLDLGSSWYPREKVLRMMDVCFYEKVPYIHLHLSHNSVCRLPFKAFPALTTSKYSYSYEDIRIMREYANARGLKLIPEFDIPGHANRLVAVYPEIFGNTISDISVLNGVVTDIGIPGNPYDVICAGSAACFEGITTIFTEIADLFPESEYIHIGGDEAFIQVWDHCPVCQKYMEEHGISDRNELYSDYIARIAQVVLDLGRTPIVWEGFPRKGSERIPRETIVIAWESFYNLAPDLLEDGFKIINGSWEPLYIVFNRRRWTTKEIMDWNVCEWKNWNPKSIAALNPIHVQNSDQVWGAQISIWGCTYENEINITIENLGAMSERCWNLTRTTDEQTYHTMSDQMSRKILKMIQDR